MSTTPNSADGVTPDPGRRTLWMALVGGVAVLVAVLLVIVAVRAGSDDGGSPTASAPSSTGQPTSAPTTGKPQKPGKPGNTSAPTTGQPSLNPTAPVNPRKPQKVDFDETGQPAKNVTLDITKIEAVQGKAQIRGEISGPALRLTLSVQNNKDVAVPIGAALSNLYYGPDRTPAGSILKPGAKPFPATVPAQGQATGVFVFTVPKKQRGEVVLEVVLDNELRVIEFNGGCPELC